jgi:predicted peptidase
MTNVATAVFDPLASKIASRRKFGWLEAALLMSIIALVAQLAGPSLLQTWWEWPRPGKQIAISPLLTAADGRQWEAPCWMYFPKDYSSSRRFPLLLFLHGSGERGHDLKLTLKHGLPGMLTNGKELPVLVLSPQCPIEHTWESAELLALLDWAEAKYSVDPDRIYVCGFSMGGYGAWQLAAEAPQRFAALVPIAGGGDEANANRLEKLPIWAFHGDQDRTVPVEQTTKMIDAIRNAGGNPRMSILDGQGHGIAGQVLSRSDLYEWLLQQTLSRPYPPEFSSGDKGQR